MPPRRKKVSELEVVWDKCIEHGLIYDDEKFDPIYESLYVADELQMLLNVYLDEEELRPNLVDWVEDTLKKFNEMMKVYKDIDSMITVNLTRDELWKIFEDDFNIIVDQDMEGKTTERYSKFVKESLSMAELAQYYINDTTLGMVMKGDLFHILLDKLDHYGRYVDFDKLNAKVKETSKYLGKDIAKNVLGRYLYSYRTVFYQLTKSFSLGEDFGDKSETLQKYVNMDNLLALYKTAFHLPINVAFFRIHNFTRIFAVTVFSKRDPGGLSISEDDILYIDDDWGWDNEHQHLDFFDVNISKEIVYAQMVYPEGFVENRFIKQD
jgi:hypothetical protein